MTGNFEEGNDELRILHFVRLDVIGGAERYFDGYISKTYNRPGMRQGAFLVQDGIHTFFGHLKRHRNIRFFDKKRIGLLKIPKSPACLRRSHWQAAARKYAPGLALFWNQLLEPDLILAARRAGLVPIYWERGISWQIDYSNRHALATLAHVDKVIANSSAGAHIVRHRGYEGDIEICPNAVRPDIFYAPTIPKKAPVGRPWLVGVASRLVSYKGVALALHALASAIRAGASLKLIIAGSGPDLPRLQQLAADLNVSQHIEFLGVVRDMLSFFNTIDCLLHPALCDASPNSVAEALCCGCPVVATNVDGMPEVVPANCGYLVSPKLDAEVYCELGVSGDDLPNYVYDPVSKEVRPPRAPEPKMLGEALISLIQDPSAYETMSETCLEYASTRFDPEVKYEELLQILRRASAGNQGDSPTGG